MFYTILEKLALQEKPIKTKVLKHQLNIGKKLDKVWDFIEQIDLIFNGNSTYTTGKYGIVQVLSELTEHFLYGICTLKGHKLINKYKEITEEE